MKGGIIMQASKKEKIYKEVEIINIHPALKTFQQHKKIKMKNKIRKILDYKYIK